MSRSCCSSRPRRSASRRSPSRRTASASMWPRARRRARSPIRSACSASASRSSPSTSASDWIASRSRTTSRNSSSDGRSLGTGRRAGIRAGSTIPDKATGALPRASRRQCARPLARGARAADAVAVPVVATPVSDTEPRFTIEASDGPVVLARVHARRPREDLLVVHRVEPGPPGSPPSPDALAAVAKSIAAWASDVRREVLLVEKPELLSLHEALVATGFVVARRKVFVARDLAPPLPDPGDVWRLRSLEQTREDEFIWRMFLASTGDPFEERKGVERDLGREWRELVASAGPRFVPARWLLADDARGPVGVVLPPFQRPHLGTLYYVGVIPARRGEGLGRALHALGLARLAADGAKRYVGSTDTRNAAMRRVFERNGCPVEGTEAYLTLARAG